MDFFIPGTANTDEAEALLARFAASAEAVVPASGERIYSLRFRRDKGVVCTATVGEQLTVTTTTRVGKGALAIDRERPVRQSVTVRAILPGPPYLIFTDARPWGDVRTDWANPINTSSPIGQPELFD